MKIAGLLIIGVVLGIVMPSCIQRLYRSTDYYKIKTCIEIFERNGDADSDVFQEIAREAGFKDVHELIRDRCEDWVKRAEK